jgi:Arylsulfotransferase (ASST)/Dockerin type I domain
LTKKYYVCQTIVLLLFILLNSPTLDAQGSTVGLIKYDPESMEGYTLFAPMSSTTTYLIDIYGRIVHSWESEYTPNNSVYLLENGNLLRSARIPGEGNTTGGVQEIAWDGTILWEFQYSGEDYFQHHDIEILPNGNILMIVRETKTYEEAIQAGRDPSLMDHSTLSPESVIEVEPFGTDSANIVWEWHIWDHLIQDYDSTKDNYAVVADHPELLNINFALHGKSNWNHINGIDYNRDFDQIMLSCRHLNEIWVLDHSTTTLDAASHTGGQSGMGGDFLFRWGNPQSYHAGNSGNQKLYAQHDAHWIENGLPGAGNVLVFNNGNGRPEGNFSSVEEFVPPVDSLGYYQIPEHGHPFGPENTVWSYQANTPEDFYSSFISGSQRMINTNTLICSGGNGKLFEVTSEGEIVWEYINPVSDLGIVDQGEVIAEGYNNVFRCYRYSADYPGFDGHDLIPGNLIELYPITVSGMNYFPSHPSESDSITITATIISESTILATDLFYDAGSGFQFVAMYDDGMHNDILQGDDIYGAIIPPQPPATKVTFYAYVENNETHLTDPPIAPFATYNFIVDPGDYICGDANSDLTVNVSDAVYIINYVFVGGNAPLSYESGDTNCDSTVNVSDAVWIINYVFVGGNAPCDTDGDTIPDC